MDESNPLEALAALAALAAEEERDSLPHDTILHTILRLYDRHLVRTSLSHGSWKKR